MRLRASLLFIAPAAAVLLVACQDRHPVDPSRDASSLRASRQSAGFATLTKLATLGSNSEAYGVNAAGNVVVGQSFESSGMLRAVKWTFANGAWSLATLPYSSSASAHGVNDQGDVVGYGATGPRQAVFWPAAGGSIALGCATDAGATTAGRQRGGSGGRRSGRRKRGAVDPRRQLPGDVARACGRRLVGCPCRE